MNCYPERTHEQKNAKGATTFGKETAATEIESCRKKLTVGPVETKSGPTCGGLR